MHISKGGHIPIYYQLKQVIISKIKSGELKENQQIPTEDEFCRMYNISKAPVRQALQELEAENYIYKIRGKGSFVSSNYIKQPMAKLQSFTKDILSIGHRPGAKLISRSIIPADYEVAEALNIEEGERVLQGVRLRFIDDEIYSLNYSYFSINRVPEIEQMDLSVLSIYEAIENELNCEIVRAIQTLEATATPPDISKIINRQIGSPLLLMNRVTFIRKDLKEMPFEYVKVYFMPDKYKCEVQLSKY
ncbi:MAG: GntR family transcriptional regulator [Clostridiaceae bacterium]|nr:GntR family transcriptional regulator [Clostridiaceae bacterium]